MILPDFNLLIYAIDDDALAHDRALRWWEASRSGTETVGLAWTVPMGFVRLTTSPRIARRPLSSDEALETR